MHLTFAGTGCHLRTDVRKHVGVLLHGEQRHAMRGAIRELVAAGNKKILLNLAGVSHIDSSGLGELIASHITLRDKGGEIKLIHLTERLRELMTITKLLTVFDVYDDEPEALASFAGETLMIKQTQPFFM